jgi:hypothetical protein
VLWAQGRPNAALAVEDVWNNLLGHHPFSLLCGYPVTGLADADVASGRDGGMNCRFSLLP